MEQSATPAGPPEPPPAETEEWAAPRSRGGAWIALAVHPQPLFAYSAQRANVVLHARAPLPPQAGALLDDVVGRVARSPLYDAGRTHHVFLCDTPAVFRNASSSTKNAPATTAPDSCSTPMTTTTVNHTRLDVIGWNDSGSKMRACCVSKAPPIPAMNALMANTNNL